jgi:peptidoglycan/LPS O-acetylase OafA/YrhL
MNNETEPMFLRFFIAFGPFLLIASRKPSSHRLLIVFTAWWNLAHGSVMAIQTVEAWQHGVHRNFADVVIVLTIGGLLLVLSPKKQKHSQSAV